MKTQFIKWIPAMLISVIIGTVLNSCKDDVLIPVADTKKADSLVSVITKLDKQDVTIIEADNSIRIQNAILQSTLDSLSEAFDNNPRKIEYTVYLINAGTTISTVNGERINGIDNATVTVSSGGKTLTATSADGRVVFEGLGGGNASVSVSATGFTTVSYQTYFFLDNRSTYGDGAVRAASTNVMMLPTSGKDAVTITGQLYANKSTIDDTLGTQFSNSGDALRYLKYVSFPGISDFYNYTQGTQHNTAPYTSFPFNPNNHYDNFPDETTVQYDQLTSLSSKIYGHPQSFTCAGFNNFDPNVPGQILTITYHGLASVATVDANGKYTLVVGSYANFPGVNMSVAHYTDNHTFLTDVNTVGSVKINLASFDPTTYVTTKADYYKFTTKFIYRASITDDDGGFTGMNYSADLYEFVYKYSGYTTNKASFAGVPGSAITRNIYFYPTVPAL